MDASLETPEAVSSRNSPFEFQNARFVAPRILKLRKLEEVRVLRWKHLLGSVPSRPLPMKNMQLMSEARFSRSRTALLKKRRATKEMIEPRV
jgi:hypothetical protein